MTYSNLNPNAKNLVYLGGMMNVKPEWMPGLTENFADQVHQFSEAWEAQDKNADELNFVVGFNSQKSVDATNEARRALKTGEDDIVTYMNEAERIKAFEKMAYDIYAAGIIMFDQEKLGELFIDYAAEGQPFVGIVKRGYNADGKDGLPICEGMAYLSAQPSTFVLTLPAWEGVAGSPTTASTHMPK